MIPKNQILQQMKNLKVYKASAGSGKTFTLAVEYIRLLIIDPFNYSHILAVTFTNKATGEMKDRIVSTLHGLAAGLPSVDDYLDKLSSRLKENGYTYSEEYIRRQSQKALDLIIHDYSHFRIETIDAFFQSIIRVLARELNLTANLRVDLNQDEALDEAVQAMIDSISEDKETREAVKSYVFDNLSEGANWKIADRMKDFSRHIFSEVYLKNKNLLLNKTDIKTFREFKSYLRNREKMITEQQKVIGQQFLELCTHSGFTSDDFSGKSRQGLWPFFSKMADGVIPNVTDTIRGYLTKDFSKTPAVISCAPQIIDLLSKAILLLDESAPVLASIRLLLKNLNQTMLLSKVDERLRRLNEEANRFLLADTAYFLRELISGSDVPFIYEKAGSQFRYIMIDEFQDTSELQWDNFKPLLSNSLSAGNDCLLVGDVKQSIYRWRNSDWSILNNIGSGEFAGYIDDKPLDTNYRSAENIVEFNNDFFQTVIPVLKDNLIAACNADSSLAKDLETAYSTVFQKVPDSKKGIGSVVMQSFESEDDYTEDILNRLSEQILSLLGFGVRQSDIAILVRTRKETAMICRSLAASLPSDVKVISSEAYMLSSSPALEIMVAALRLLASPNERLLRLNLAYKYQMKVVQSHNPQSQIDKRRFFLLESDTLQSMLPTEFVKSEGELASMPLYELCERLYSIFRLDVIPDQDAYLFSFFDELSAYVGDKPSTIASFIETWDKSIGSKTIPSAASDGIQIMTIHKSKGLEFHTVFVPFCTWEIGVKRSFSPVLWCQPRSEEFRKIPLAALSFSNDMKMSEFSDEYDRELLKTYVDNLNLIYVAFTRPSRNLFVYTGAKLRQTKNGISKSTSAFDCYDLLKLTVLKDCDTYSKGEIYTIVKDRHVVCEEIPISFRSGSCNVQFRQSNKSEEFINGSGSDSDYYINKGLVVHKVMEMLQSFSDLDRILLQLDCDGVFPDRAFRDDVEQTVRRALSDTTVSRWFSPEWTVLNECSILSTDSDGNVLVHRPDRVITDGSETIVIDYKTGRQSDSHVRQVENYMELLRQMGYPNVKGYLWYMNRKDIVAIEE